VSHTPILKVAVNVPLSREFDYLAPATGQSPAIGARVLVPFGRRQKIGVVTALASESALPEAKIRRCTEILDEIPLLSPADLWLIRFTSDYYHHPIGEVVAAALPSLLRLGKSLHPSVERITISDAGAAADIEALSKRAPKQAALLATLKDAAADGLDPDLLTETLPTWRRAASALLKKGLISISARRAEDFDEKLSRERRAGPTLNVDQEHALSALRRNDRFGAFVLDGVTGSGKTEVYLQRVQDVLDSGKQALFLVPEIGLTPQLVARLSERLGLKPALLHSGLSDTARLAAWRAARSGAARLIVGTRSAIFTPLKNPGLIVVDEEHDHSFKQQEGLRYSARDLAIAKAKHLDVPVILGSATPSLEILQHCRNGSYQHLVLPARAGEAKPPKLRLIDTMRSPASDGISEPLAEAMRRHLDDGNQVLVFLNRRGFAPTLICRQCGYVVACERCDSRMTVHAREQQLRCHHCGACRPLTEQCDECGEAVIPLGEGTQRLEESLTTRFPDAVISRIDSDSTQLKGAMHDALQNATLGRHANVIERASLSRPDPGRHRQCRSGIVRHRFSQQRAHGAVNYSGFGARRA